MMLRRLAVAVLAMAAAITVTQSGIASAQTAHTYYVNCSASVNGTGTAASPWNSTAAPNARTFTAGDRILFRSGTACTGELLPRGSGRSGAPITLAAYGTGAKPAIRAAAGQQSALTLRDSSWWTVTGLDLSGGARYGVFVTVTSGVVRGITLSGLTVHDVTGGYLDSKNTGLVVLSPTTDATNSTRARFDRVLVDGVVAHGTTLWAGIIVGSGTGAGWAPDESLRSTNVVVRNSTVYDVYGDGIILFAVANGLLDHNVAHDTGVQPTQTIGTPNAIWTWACNGCVVQHNEAYHNDSPGFDGGAFDVDFWSRDTVVQYNYGHDNSAYCIAVFGAENSTTTNAVIRYNVCANNGTQDVTGRQEVFFAVWNGGTIDGVQLYGNTFVTNNGLLYAVSWNADGSLFTGSRPLTFRNNLVYATTANPYGPGGTTALSSHHNLWYSTAGAWTNGEPGSVYANPRLRNAAHPAAGLATTSFDLLAGSPAIDAGATISGSGGLDFKGTRVPRGSAFDIGAVEYTG